MNDGGRLKTIQSKGKSTARLLAENLDTVVIIRNDLECKAILGSMGMLDCFAKSDGPSWSLAGSDDYKTHFVVGMRFSGNPKSEDNGYVVYFVPKSGSMRTLQEVVDYFSEIQGGSGGKKPTVLRSPPWKGN